MNASRTRRSVEWLTRGQPPEMQMAFAPDLAAASRRLRTLTAEKGELPTIVSRARLIWTMAMAAHVLRTGIAGDIVETGVFTGGSTIAMMSMLQKQPSTLERPVWACDSFKGLPPPVSQDRNCARKVAGGAQDCHVGASGAFASGLGIFRRNLEHFGMEQTHHRLHVVVGWYNETLPPRGLRKIAFLRLDGDLYVSTMDALKALYPLVVDGGLVYVDDYGSFAGCSAAVDAYLAAQPGPAPKLHRLLEPRPAASDERAGGPQVDRMAFEAVVFRKPATKHTSS